MRIDISRKCFDGKEILRDFSLELAAGEAVALLGPSGIGKSTILRIVAGLDEDFEGRVDDAGRIALVFQEPTLLPWRTLRRNLMIATRCDGEAADIALDSVGLAGLGDRFPRTLSLGQARRVSIERAYLTQPEILLFDEPFASLDPDSVESIIQHLLEFWTRNSTRMLLVTHDAHQAQRLCDRVIHLTG